MLIHGFQIAIDLVPECLTHPVQIEEVSAARYESAPISGETSGRVEAVLPGGVRTTLLVGKGTIDDKTLTLEGSLGAVTANIETGRVTHLPSEGAPRRPRVNGAEAYEAVLEEALALRQSPTCPTTVSNKGWLVGYSEALRALELVEAARSWPDLQVETHPVGTIPSVMADRRVAGGCTVEVYDSPAEAALAVVREIILSSRASIRRSGRFVLVIPGGSPSSRQAVR